MTHPDWERIQEIYHAALAKPRSERGVFVAKALDGEPALITKVNELLAADESLGGFLESPVFELGLKPTSSSNNTNSSSTDKLVGTTIAGRYYIERPLDHGGMSKVYLASDLELNNRPVVIKVLSQTLLQNPDAVRRFRQEVVALSHIDHPNVVSVLGAGELADGKPYIVMQYVDGDTLQSQIPTEGMNLDRAASILKQIGSALEHVHEKGIFHRDLKPQNIMLKRGTDSVVLVDFGVAKVRDSVIVPTTANGVTVGTVLYMSPEQLRGERVTAATDIYSMAMVAYEMVTGRRPFNPTSASQMLQMQRADVPVKPIHLRPNLPIKAQSIILRALSFEPKARYQSAREFGDDLAHALPGSRVRTQKKQPLKVISASLLVLAGVALLSFGIYKYLIQPPPEPGPKHSFTYWVTVQPMRDGKPYQEPFKSNGKEDTFDSGDRFQLNVASPDPGYLYVFNETLPESNGSSFTILYPTGDTNNGSANIGANQTVQTGWLTFRGPPGNENVWIIWSASPVSELESAKSEAFKNPDGGLTGQNLITVRQYLTTKQPEAKARRYTETQKAVVRGPGDTLVTRAEFKHR